MRHLKQRKVRMINILNRLICKKHNLPFQISGVYPFSEWGNSKSEFCAHLWGGISWDIGTLRPMFKKNGIIAWYKNTAAYYEIGNALLPSSPKAQSEYRDFVFHHIEREGK